MTVKNSNKDLNYGLIMKYLRKKQIILPSFEGLRTQVCIEALDWYTAYQSSKMPDMDIKYVRQAVAEEFANREISLDYIRELRLRKEGATA